MHPLRVGILILTAIVFAACASSGEPRAQGARDVITAEEIGAIDVSTALEVVQRLRPQFLRSRGTTTLSSAGPEGQPMGRGNTSGAELVVYVDNVRMGGVAVLGSINARQVREIRFVNASDATTKYGTGHMGGVIEVRTIR